MTTLVKSRFRAWMIAAFMGWACCSLAFIFAESGGNARIGEVLFYSQMFSIAILMPLLMPTLSGVAVASYRLRSVKLSFHLLVAFGLLIFFSMTASMYYGGTLLGSIEMWTGKETVMLFGSTLFATFIYWKLSNPLALRPGGEKDSTVSR